VPGGEDKSLKKLDFKQRRMGERYEPGYRKGRRKNKIGGDNSQGEVWCEGLLIKRGQNNPCDGFSSKKPGERFGSTGARKTENRRRRGGI